MIILDYITIILGLAAIVFYCVYTYHKDNAHIDKLIEDADKNNDNTNNNTARAPWNRK